jgi:signal transduction histidine kinase
MRFLKSLRARLTVMVAVSIVVTGIVVLLYGFFIARSSLREQVFKTMDTVVLRTVRDVQTSNNDMTAVSAVVASDSHLRGYLEAYMGSGVDKATLTAEIKRVLDDARSTLPGIDEISVYSPEGVRIASTAGRPRVAPLQGTSSASETALPTASGGRVSLDFTFSGGEMMLVLARGIQGPTGDNPVAVLTMNGKVTGLQKELSDTKGLGVSGAILLSKSDGATVNVFNLPEPNARHSDTGTSSLLSFSRSSRLPAVRAALGESGSGESTDGTGRSIVVSYGGVPDVKWGVTATALSSEVFAPIYGLRNVMIIVTLVLLFGGSLLAYLIARSITRPILELQDGVKALGGGELSTRVTISDGLEVTALADEFNRMASRLDELYQNLEKKVAERTVELREANARLLELDNLKSEFVSIVSHEVRSPLASMKMGISSVVGEVVGPLNDEQKLMLSIANRNLDRLTKLTTDLLDLDRIEAGRLQLQRGECDMLELAREVAAASEPHARQRGLYINVQPDGGPLNASCDRDRTYQVIQNLLGNALKFTETGGVTIEIERADASESERGTGEPGAGEEVAGGPTVADGAMRGTREYIRVCVRDTGPGIPSDAMRTIFDRFSQAHVEMSSEKRGTGLGLAISKGIVEAQGGTISAWSELGKGSRFCFTMPDAASAPRDSFESEADPDGDGPPGTAHAPEAARMESTTGEKHAETDKEEDTDSR